MYKKKCFKKINLRSQICWGWVQPPQPLFFHFTQESRGEFRHAHKVKVIPTNAQPCWVSAHLQSRTTHTICHHQSSSRTRVAPLSCLHLYYTTNLFVCQVFFITFLNFFIFFLFYFIFNHWNEFPRNPLTKKANRNHTNTYTEPK